MAPFVSGLKRNYIFGGISGIAANAFIKVHIFFIPPDSLGVLIS